MDKKIKQQLEEHYKKAKETGKKHIKSKLPPGYSTFLTRNITTKEQGDALMKMLTSS